MANPGRALAARASLCFLLAAGAISSCRLPGLCYRGLSMRMPPELQLVGLALGDAALVVYVWAHFALAVFGAQPACAMDGGEAPPSPTAVGGSGGGAAGGLVVSGPYRWMRHPQLAAAGALIVGAWLATGDGLVAVALATLWGNLAARVPAEERELYHLYGEAYATYRSATGALLPGACLGRGGVGGVPSVVYTLAGAETEGLPLQGSAGVWKEAGQRKVSPNRL